MSYMCVQLGLLNLVLAVILDNVRRKHEDDLAFKANAIAKRQEESTTRLLDMISAIDENEDGAVTLEELLNGYDDNEDFRNLMTCLHLCRDDLSDYFKTVDTNNTGTIDYTGFVKNIEASQSQDLRVQMEVMRKYLVSISKDVSDVMKKLTRDAVGQTSDTSHAKKQRQSRRGMGATLTTLTSLDGVPPCEAPCGDVSGNGIEIPSSGIESPSSPGSHRGSNELVGRMKKFEQEGLWLSANFETQPCCVNAGTTAELRQYERPPTMHDRPGGAHPDGREPATDNRGRLTH